jgi:putative ABC transport system substrate-binding protein
MNADVVVAIATVSAQSFAKAANEGKVKVAFSTVTDPLGAHIVNTLQAPGNNTSGVSNFVDLTPQVMLFQRIQPTLKRLGIIYNPGEVNGVKIIKELEKVCASLDLVLVKQTVTRTGDVPQAAAKLAANVDAIFISNDNTALSGFQSIVKAARDAQKPVYVSDTDEVSQGAVAALGPNQYEVGKQTGCMVIRAINGEDLGVIPVEFPTNTELHINLDAARKAGIDMPQEIIDSAAKIIN